jgi:hypothetical protein
MQSNQDRIYDLVAAALLAMGLLTAIENLVTVFITFRHWKGLYFWSMLCTTVSVVGINISDIFGIWEINSIAEIAIQLPFYLIYVVFQFLMLYSRLHLISASKRVLHLALLAIFIFVIILAIPICVGRIIATLNPYSNFAQGQSIKIWWLTGIAFYALLDLMLLSTYIWHIKTVWCHNVETQEKVGLRNLIFMSMFMISCDLAYGILMDRVDFRLYLSIAV